MLLGLNSLFDSCMEYVLHNRTLFLYLAAINIITLLVILIDRLKDERSFWGVIALFLIILLGGSLGAIIATLLLRKKKKDFFTYISPIMMVGHIVLFFYLKKSGWV